MYVKNCIFQFILYIFEYMSYVIHANRKCCTNIPRNNNFFSSRLSNKNSFIFWGVLFNFSLNSLYYIIVCACLTHILFYTCLIFHKNLINFLVILRSFSAFLVSWNVIYKLCNIIKVYISVFRVGLVGS